LSPEGADPAVTSSGPQQTAALSAFEEIPAAMIVLLPERVNLSPGESGAVEAFDKVARDVAGAKEKHGLQAPNEPAPNSSTFVGNQPRSCAYPTRPIRS
jgi:hypothetical protein